MEESSEAQDLAKELAARRGWRHKPWNRLWVHHPNDLAGRPGICLCSRSHFVPHDPFLQQAPCRRKVVKLWIVTTPRGAEEVFATKVSIKDGVLFLMDGEALKKLYAQGAWFSVEPKEAQQ
jgi:hypothetical protein